MGQRRALSSTDKKKLRTLYQCERTKVRTDCQRGGSAGGGGGIAVFTILALHFLLDIIK